MIVTTSGASAHLPVDAIRRLLAHRDLTDPAAGPHAVQQVVDAVERALADHTGTPVHRHRMNPVVPVVDNYDRLGYPADATARDTRYTRYLNDDVMLRAHTSAAMPWLHERIAHGDLHAEEPELVLSVPGICYRRDVVDRQHVGEPHQLDVWQLRRGGTPLTVDDLEAYLRAAVAAVLPDAAVRTTPAVHPYTRHGREIEVASGDAWIEVGECGLTDPDLLRRSGLSPDATGLAMGLGLDRLVMLVKGIDDIRLLRASDPRIASQLLDLTPLRPVSSMPPVRRDLSVAVPPELDDDELVGDRVRDALGPAASSVESIEVLSRTAVASLPTSARERLGAREGQVNLLLRIVLRDLERTLTSEEANQLRDEVYAALHHGTAHQWATERG
jgi:phenylalanyl-tRNA synthetase alpha chain